MNLIDEINKLTPYIDRFRMDFLDESYDEVVNIITNINDVLQDNSNEFKLPSQTKGHFKRSVL